MYDNGIDIIPNADDAGLCLVVKDGEIVARDMPRWQANWNYKRRYSPAIAAMMDNWDGGDPWGSAMSMAWAVATCARSLGNYEPATILDVSWGMEPVYAVEDLAGDDPEGEVQFETNCLADALMDGRVTENDLIFAAKVLHRYLAILDKAGMSY